MSLQEAAEAAARQNPPAEASTSTSAVPPAQTVTDSSASADTDVGLPSTLTQPLHNLSVPSETAPGDSGIAPARADIIEHEEDEDEMLRRAMALSRGEAGDDVEMAEHLEGDDDEEDEEEAIARAIAISLQEAKGDDDKAPKEPRPEA
jgi:26S proteasome regulatory subunit N10